TYASGSFLWLGIMFLAMTREMSSMLWAGGLCLFIFRRAALKSDPGAFQRGRGGFPVDFAATLLLIGLQLLLWRFCFFFRDPDRRAPARAALVSPADGIVVYVRPVERGRAPLSVKENALIPLSEIMAMKPAGIERGVLLGIFMTPLSVHVNRSPVSGKLAGRA